RSTAPGGSTSPRFWPEPARRRRARLRILRLCASRPGTGAARTAPYASDMSGVVLSIQASTDDVAAVADAVVRCMRDTMGADAPADAAGRVRRVFPAGTPSRRGRLFTMTIPEGVSPVKIQEFVGRLKGDASID